MGDQPGFPEGEPQPQFQEGGEDLGTARSKTIEHSRELVNAFAPVRCFLTWIGQMPIEIRMKKDGTYSFKLNPRSCSWIIFLFIFAVTTICYMFITAGICVFVFRDLSSQWIVPEEFVLVKDPVTGENENQLWERYYARKQMIPVIVVWNWMTVSFVGSLHIITYGKFYVHYMNYFNRVVQLMDIDMTPGIRTYLMKNSILTLTTAAMVIFGYVIHFVIDFRPIVDTTEVLANFVLRMFKAEIATFSPGQRIVSQIFALVVMVFSLVASRANVIQFLFFSQLLKNGTKVWNQRFSIVLEIGQKELKGRGYMANADSDQGFKRLELKQVMKDHLIFVQLFRITESVFGFTLLTYYCFEMISIIIEVYQLAALGGFKNDKKLGATIPNDHGVYDTDTVYSREILETTIVNVLLMLQHIWFATRTTTDAAMAYEQAMEGFNILRQHGFMYCRNKEDRNFVLSMFMSFSKNAPMQLTASGYFVINKMLLVAITAAIVNWAVSIYQTRIDQWK